MALLALLGACTNKNATLGVSVVPATVSFSMHVWPILSVTGGCTASFCHGGSAISANLNLEKIFDPAVGAVDVASCEAPSLLRIAPFNSDGSYLVKKLENTQQTAMCATCDTGTAGPVSNCGSLMPLGTTGLLPADIKTIRDWIDQGALDN